ncbi:MAG: hypothetical protein NVSMB31_10430 [Vulcanimicrobiaceae bacterium]
MIATFADLFSHLVAAITCAAAGLIIWDVGTRSPLRVATSILTALRTPKTLARGVIRFLVGAVFIAASALLLILILPQNEFARYTLYQIVAFLAALAVELLIGEDVRPLLGLNRGTGAR